MDLQLTAVEARLVGALIEKELTTPEYYPLTLNGLITACNQKSNRNPVVTYDEDTAKIGLEGLHKKHLLATAIGGGSRTKKYRHLLDQKFDFDRKQVAVLCVLLLRGPQTLGEIRTRTGRMFAFADLDAVAAVVEGLMSAEESDAFVVETARLAGQKDTRYMHRLCGEPELEEMPEEPAVRSAAKSSAVNAVSPKISASRCFIACR